MGHPETCNHPDYAVVIDNQGARYQAALKLVDHLEYLLRWRQSYDCDNRPLTTPMEVVNAVLDGRWPVGQK